MTRGIPEVQLTSSFAGPALSNALVNAGLTSFAKLEERSARDIETVV